VLSVPYGSGSDFPFTEPNVVSAHVSAANMAPILLRINSGSNVPVLYATDSSIHKPGASRAPMLKRVVNGAEQAFAVLPPQDLLVGAESIRQVSFVMPMNFGWYGVCSVRKWAAANVDLSSSIYLLRASLCNPGPLVILVRQLCLSWRLACKSKHLEKAICGEV